MRTDDREAQLLRDLGGVPSRWGRARGEVVRVCSFHDGKAIRVRSPYTHGYAAALLGT